MPRATSGRRKGSSFRFNFGEYPYVYDRMGNIVSINENGKQIYKYTYDKLGRLVLEKDLYKNIFLKMRLGRVKCFQINRFYGTIYRKEFQEGTE